MRERIIQIFTYLLLIILRGSVQIILYLSQPYYPPISFVAIRGIAASFLLGIVIWIKYKMTVSFKQDLQTSPKIKLILLEIMMGSLNVFAPFVIYTYTVPYIGADIGALFMAATSLFLIILTPIFGDSKKDPITLIKGIGALIGFTGVGVVTAAGFIFGKDKGTKSIWPYPVCLAGVLSQAFAQTLWKRFSNIIPKSDKKEIFGVRELVGVWGQNFVAAIMGIIGAFAWDWLHPPPGLDEHFIWITKIGDWKSIFVLVWMSVISGVIVSLCIYYLIGSIGAALTASATCGYPVVALIEGIIFLDIWGKLELGGKLMQVGGTLLVIIGLFIPMKFSKNPDTQAILEKSKSTRFSVGYENEDISDSFENGQVEEEVDFLGKIN